MPEPFSNRASFSLLRRWAAALNVIVSAAALFAIVAMVNYLSSRHFWRSELSSTPRFQLSPMTRQLLAGLTNEVRVTVLFDPEESLLFSSVKGLLTEYQLTSPRVQVDYVNYGRDPHRADVLKSQYKLGGGSDTLLVIFDSAGRPPRVVRERELSDYDVEGALQGEPVRRRGFKGEQFFTSALLAVAESRPIPALYVVGNGEPDLEREDAPEGYRRFAELLAEHNIVLQTVALNAQEIPADCPLLIVAGARRMVPAGELQKMDRYLKGGGRALILMLSPARVDVRRPGLDRLLADWGVEVGDDLVMDRAQSKSDAPQLLLTGFWGEHPLVRPLHGSRLGLVMPCSIRPRATASGATDAAKVTELAFTSREGMVVTHVRGGQGTVDAQGVIPLAVAVEKGAISGVSADRGATRLVVVGDATCLSNGLIDLEANRDFAVLSVNWLLDHRHLLAIPPRPLADYRISLSTSQMRAITWLLLGGLPGGMLLVGLFVWVRRRK